ncbi:hypothetical protein HXA34_11255 [Salipaludibacillus agaradhaerens]|jgi:hypothetical protein|uniref:hypothetical protein n=1 Tax=Salipaludibacillus agaradhaerens TaxID=76935 RepID=UPI002151F666|nr:hypothetical protein [Salipaludibacillus agaradhaerens]MCR6106865.1 hypothetical protein [Salipaludibacillus agaradhaerens]MCR6118897.1 hypothetical protein [Salipaludibacillus agaradhaerens]
MSKKQNRTEHIVVRYSKKEREEVVDRYIVKFGHSYSNAIRLTSLDKMKEELERE